MSPVTPIDPAAATAARGGAVPDTIVGDAVRVAAAAARAAGVEIRELDDLADLDAVYRLYDRIWRPDPANPPVTTELLRALSKAGNYVTGAYDAGELIGACVGFFGEPSGAALHSHIAGVTGAARGRHVGVALKVHQRAWALRRGIREIAWTFDPLIRRNAHFNLVKLAARATEYLPNFYGGVHDHINGTDDTDRLLVRWPLTDPAVIKACAQRGGPAGASGAAAGGDRADHGADVPVALGISDRGEPVPVDLGADTDGAASTGGGAVRVAVPPDIEGLRGTDPDLARRWRTAVRETLGAAMASGAQVTGFDRAGWYLLRRKPADGGDPAAFVPPTDSRRRRSP